jgi:hypothetical protein
LEGAVVAGQDISDGIDSSDLDGNYFSYLGFSPLGGTSAFESILLNMFNGILDGQGHKITNLYINRPDEVFVGLFRATKGRIQNIGLEDVNIEGYVFNGSFSGMSLGSVSGVYSTGVASGYGLTGGIFGIAVGGVWIIVILQ